MRRLFLTIGFVASFCSGVFAAPKFPRDLSVWEECVIPPKHPAGDRRVWEYSAELSPNEWHVYLSEGKVEAGVSAEGRKVDEAGPEFSPQAESFRVASKSVAVDDGWLVAFDDGEFGAALYWFSKDGKEKTKISDHQVQDFVKLGDGVYAVEGLDHMGLSQGSVIRIGRRKDDGKWEASTVVKLPFAPYAVSVKKDGTMLITLSNSLVAVGREKRVVTLLSDDLWGGLYPNSSALSPDEKRLYIGMRQFVGEYDLATKKFRMLVPSKEFLNQIPKDEAERLRKLYGE